MTTFFERLKNDAASLITEFGSGVTIRRKVTSYDTQTRRNTELTALEQVRQAAIFPAGMGLKKMPDSFTSMFERVAYVSASIDSGTDFAPDIKDVIDDGEVVWAIKAAAIEVHQGTTVFYTFGLDKA